MSTGASDEFGARAPEGSAETSRTTTATPRQVWSVLADGWLYASWVVGTSRIRLVEGAWPAVGSRIHHSVGNWPLLLDDETEVLEAEPGRRLVLQARGRPMGEARVVLQVDPAPGGSTVTMIEDATHGLTRLAPRPLRQLVVVPRNRESLRRLAYLAERGAR